ncbi:MAG: response regulator [Pseudomonadota bacterium]
MLTFIPVFVFIIGTVLYLLADWYVEQQGDQLSARIGSQAGKISGVLDQELLEGDPAFVRQLLNTMMSDPAILCVDVNRGGTALKAYSQPRRLGCEVINPEKNVLISLPKMKQFSLNVGFTESELRQTRMEAMYLAGIVATIAVICAMVLSVLAFRTSVGTAIASLLKSVRDVEAGHFKPLHVRRRDEMGHLFNAFNEMTERLRLRDREINEALATAKAADRAKSEFLANMSHEIRTPMNGVMGMAELLASTELDRKQTMFTDVIVKSGNSLLTIINDILDFSKLDAGQMELDPAPFVISEAIEDVATLVSAKIAEKDLELIVRIDPLLPEMLIGDIGRIRQIVTNLVGNAVKFTEKGHVFVNVTPVGEAVDERQGIKVAVQDTGVGIPDEQLSKVFEKFSQVDTSATRKHEGTGLGLSICRSLIKLMEGKIGVESEFGRGSTFWFEVTLPVHEGTGRPRLPMDVSGSRILIVDDNEVNRAILSEQMTAWKFDSAAVASGSEALSMLEAVHESDIEIDCIILDYQMPEMNGGDLVAAIKSRQHLATIPIIMLTSVEETSEGKTFSSLGVQGCLTKPARSSMLLEMLVDVLQESKQTSEPHNSEMVANFEAIQRLVNSVPDETQSIFQTSSSSNLQIDVLICEDNEVNQIVFKQILESMDLNYRIANDGEEGIAHYKNFNPALIIMDVSMPRMNGLDATKEIRETEKDSGKHTPIIGVTAHALKGDMERCLEAGMDDYLSKPVSPDALSEKIVKWMQNTAAKACA